jgi:dihydrofolate reductase
MPPEYINMDKEGVQKMGKVVIHATMSLDGFIAGPDDDMNWMTEYVGPNEVADEVIRAVGAVVSGGRLFPLIEKHLDDNLPYGGAVKAPVFILTHHPRETITESGVTFQFITESFESAVRQAKAAAGDKNVMLFGASMAQLGLKTGLADEIQLHLAPILLGGGIQLFGQPGTGYVRLERMKVVESPTVTDLRFRIVK